jgi:hypothetical protein
MPKKTVSGNENSLRAHRKLVDLFFAFVVADVAGDRLDMQAVELPSEEPAQLSRDISGGRDEAAEHDRTMAVPEQPAKDFGQLPELRILLRSGERSGAFAEAREAPPLVIDADPLGLVDWPCRCVIGRLLIAEQVEHLGPVGLVHLDRGFAVLRRIVVQLSGAVAEHHRRRVGAREQRAQDCDRRPMAYPLLRRAQAACVFERLPAVVEHIGKEALISPGQLVAGLLGPALWKWGLRAEPFLDVAAPPLDEAGNEGLAIARLGKIAIKAPIEQAQ